MCKHVAVYYWALLILTVPMLNGCYSISLINQYSSKPACPKSATVTIDSIPKKANVYVFHGNTETYLGTTPYSITFDPTEDFLNVHITKEGYTGKTVTLNKCGYMVTNDSLMVLDAFLGIPFFIDLIVDSIIPSSYFYIDNYYPVVKLLSEEESGKELLR